MIEKYKDRLKEILSDEKVRSTKRRSTKRRSTKRRSKKVRSTKRSKKVRSTKRRRSKRGMLFGGELKIDSVEELRNVPDEELKAVFQDFKTMEQIKNEISVLITARKALDPDGLMKLGVLFQLRNYYNEKANKVNSPYDDSPFFTGVKVNIKPKNDNKAKEFLRDAKKINEEINEDLAKRLVAAETPPPRPQRPQNETPKPPQRPKTPQQKLEFFNDYMHIVPDKEKEYIDKVSKHMTNQDKLNLITEVIKFYETNKNYKPDSIISNKLHEGIIKKASPKNYSDEEINEMWVLIPEKEQKFISDNQGKLKDRMQTVIKYVYDVYQLIGENKLTELASEMFLNEDLQQIREASKNPENIFNQPPKRVSLSESLSQMVKRMSMSNKRNAVRLPPNALGDGISAGDDGPKTPEAALAKAKAAARGSVRRSGDNDDNYV